MWPNKSPFRRAAKWDGVIPIKRPTEDKFVHLTPDELRDIVVYIRKHRTSADPFDVVIGGETPGDDTQKAKKIVEPYIQAGATWWLEEISGVRGTFSEMKERITQGPPR
jgi:hypothetical protein